jgi:hypothetical protein
MPTTAGFTALRKSHDGPSLGFSSKDNPEQKKKT